MTVVTRYIGGRCERRNGMWKEGAMMTVYETRFVPSMKGLEGVVSKEGAD